MPFSITAKNTMLDALETAYTLYAALYNGDPAGAGVEITGGSPAYARQLVTMASAASGSIVIATDETFDVPAGATVNYVALFDALTAGNLIASDAVTEEVYGAQGQYIVTDQTYSLTD